MKTWPCTLGPIGGIKPQRMGHRLSDGELISRWRGEYLSRTVQKLARPVSDVLHVPGRSGVVHMNEIVITAALAQSEMPSHYGERYEVETSNHHEEGQRPERHW